MNEKNINLKEEIESKIVVSPVINSVPLSFWKEFKQDAELNYSNNYCMKIMSDHYKAMKMKEFNDLQERVTYLETVISGAPTEQINEEVSKGINTFGRKE